MLGTDDDWERWIQGTRELADLDAVELAAAIHSLESIREWFAAGPSGVPSLAAHPIVWQLINCAPWTRRRLTTLVQAVNAVEQVPGLDDLRGRLIRPDTFAESASLAGIGAGFLRAGWKVNAHRALGTPERRYHPDLMVEKPAGEASFLIELKQLTATQERRRHDNAFNALGMILMRLGHDMHWVGRMWRVPSAPRLSRIVTQLSEAARLAREGGFARLTQEGVCDIAIATSRHHPQLLRLATDWKLPVDSMDSPWSDTPSAKRITSAALNARHQLSVTVPSLVVVECGDPWWRPGDARPLRYDLKERIGDHPEIAAVVVIGSHLGPTEEQHWSVDEDCYRGASEHGTLSHHALLVLNPDAVTPLGGTHVRAVRSVFEL